MNYFVTGIHTDIGKTVVSAILTHALQADYWKPVQCGLPRDVDMVRSLVNNNHSVFYEEAYLLQEPASPHQAAAAEGIEISMNRILLPAINYENIIIEGAGGVLVPLNDDDMVIDIANKFDASVIIVSNNYLGSINHTLLTINEIRRRQLSIKGIIFNGPRNSYTEDIILKKTGLKCLLRVNPEPEVNQEMITHYAIDLFRNWEDD